MIALRSVMFKGGIMGNPYEIFNKFCLAEKFDCIIPEGTTSMPAQCFMNRPIGKIVIPSTMSATSGQMCDGSHIEEFEIKEGIQTIGNASFRYSDATSLVLPNSVSRIERAAFAFAYLLETVEVGTGVTYIAEFFMQNASRLKHLVFMATTPPTLQNTNCFAGLPATAVFYVPDGSVDAYKTANVWSTWASRIYPISQKP